MKRISQGKHAGKNKKTEVLTREKYQGSDWDLRMELIKALIPIGLMAVHEELEQEISDLAGARYQRDETKTGICRYGTNPGHIRLGGQKVPLKIPRVRDLRNKREIDLRTMKKMKERDAMDSLLFKRVLHGISCKNYEQAATATSEAMGLSSSSVSRQFISESQKHLKALQERSFGEMNIVALILDGKGFAEDSMIVAMGITMGGEKVILGMTQAGTENKKVVGDFLRDLVSRGLSVEDGILVIVDGSKGFLSSVKDVFREIRSYSEMPMAQARKCDQLSSQG